jgi:2',3'-cyclic-nucleotide 2'-phosphodiesterase (5'-nucleotidase family)
VANYGGTSASGTWYIYDVANTTANDFEIQGTVSVGSGVVNGACNNSTNGQTLSAAPTANLCAAGTASAVSGSGPWTWTCAGTGIGATTASCSANKASGGPFAIFHLNDTHARVTPHKWIIPSKTNLNAQFEDVGGAAYVAGEMLALTTAQPNSLVIDAGDISEGNPIGDMNGNGSMTQFYALLSGKLKNVAGRNGRGMDAVVVGNHDVRDVSYITNMEALQATGVPVLSVNIRDIATHTPHFAPYVVVTVNGTRIGILGYTTQASEVGASLAATLEVADCDWSSADSTKIHLADYVNTLRNTEHVDVVVLVAHIGHSALVDPAAPLLVDNGAAKLPEVVVSGHWHTWADTVWQPMQLNYKTIFTESGSYMKYIGELNVNATGGYVSSVQHVIRDADITPDPDVQALVANLTSQYNTAHPTQPVDQVVGYTADNLMLDNDMRWWSPDEYPWSGNNTAGQWITDAMQWKCAQLFGSCDLAVEAGGGVRSDIPKGNVTYLQIYETFPWNDDTFTRVNMTGQDIINFLKATTMDAGFSSALDVTAVDGVPTSVKFNGQPIDLSHTYTVAINNYMYAHPPSGYTWPDTAPLNDPTLVRDGIVDYMKTVHPDSNHPYTVGSARYHLNGEYAGGYRAVVTMMDDNDTKPSYDAAFVRLLSATPDTLARRGNNQVPIDLVNVDGSVNAANRLSSQDVYRSYLGFKSGVLQPGDIIETWGKAAFYGGDPEFVDQEGIQSDGVEFKIVGHDASLSKPEFMSSISAFLNDNYKNHYVKFLAKKTASDTVTDQNGQALKIWDKTGYAAVSLPGNTGDTLEITGVLTMESYALRLRSDLAIVSAATLPTASGLSSRVDPQLVTASNAITLSATAGISGGGYNLVPVADAQIESGTPAYNGGTGNNLYVQSSNTGSYGNERAWLKFDLSSIPAGSIITGATLQLWDWKATGASLPVEVRSAANDSWTGTGVNWSNQPAPGNVLDTQTLASGTANVWYNWNVTSFVQGEFAGDKTVSLVLKPVTEGSTDATSPSYGFDAREYGSNAPVLHVTTQATASSVASVSFFYRYSANNTNWGAWTQVAAADTVAPYTAGFSFPNGQGYYEFYSVATDNLGGVEATPAYAQSAVHYQAASGSSQSISFTQPADAQAGTGFAVSATATSGLPVTFSSQNPGICSVSGSTVNALTAGTCNLTADQAGDAGYWLPASATRSFNVQGLGQQTISFAALSDHALGGGSVTLSASASSGLPVQFTSLTASVCTVSGSTVNLLALGNCSIAANQAGNATYAAAPTVTHGFNVTSATADDNSDVPLPAWAMFMLAAGLLGAMKMRVGRQI